MSTFVWKDATIWAGAYDITADVTSVDADDSFDEVDMTTFGSGGNRERASGLCDVKLDVATFMDFDLSEPALHAINGSAGNIFTVTPQGASVIQTAYFGRGLAGKLKRSAKVGDAAMLNGSFSASNSEGLIRGACVLPKTTTSGTGTTNGTAYQLGAVSATQTIYGALHVFAASGTTPSITVKVQSDTVGFASPTDVLTFTAATGPTSEWKSAAGAITDDYWRVTYTISGTTPVFGIALALGIQ